MENKTKLDKAMSQIKTLKGAAKRQTTHKEYEKARLEAFEDIARKLR